MKVGEYRPPVLLRCLEFGIMNNKNMCPIFFCPIRLQNLFLKLISKNAHLPIRLSN